MASSLSPGCSRGTAKANCDCEEASRCPPRHVGLGPRGELSRRVLIDPPIAGRAGAGGWLFRLWLLPLSWLWPSMSCDFCADICAYYVLTNCLLCAYYVNHVRELGLGHLDMCILLLKVRSVLELAVSILLMQTCCNDHQNCQWHKTFPRRQKLWCIVQAVVSACSIQRHLQT